MSYQPPEIVTRDAAGLDSPRALTRRPITRVVGVMVHHAGVGYPDGADYAAVWRAIQRYHMGPHGSERPHQDIDYNVGVAPDGRVFLGRDAGVWGAHCSAPGYNERWLAVVFLGLGEACTDDAWRSILWAWSLATWQVAVAGGPQALGLLGHGEAMATACPGSIRARLDALRAFLAGLAA